MRNAVIQNWQRSWGTALSLLALLAWCLPTLMMGCVINAMPSVVSLQCSEIYSGISPGAANMQEMPCCHKIPVPQTQSTNSQSAVISTDGHINLSTISFPPSHAPLWALLIASPNFEEDGDVKSTFPLENFSSPPSAEAASPLLGRAPPSLI
jgi:hypothetical protein